MNIRIRNRKSKLAAGIALFGLLSGSVFFQNIPSVSAATYPAQILDLANWKETLPTGSSGSPTEITQTALATYYNSTFFHANSTADGVVFRAPVNGVTTSGSGYPRSELREMTNSGKSLASWATNSGTNSMFIDEAITAVPKTKRHVVAGQIHDASDDVVVIRLEYPKLFVDINGQTGPTLDSNYTLGKRFTVNFVAANGQIKIYYNGSATPAYTMNKIGSGNYFKAGAYTQSNCSKETDCSSSNYGEVVIYKLKVQHGDSIILAPAPAPTSTSTSTSTPTSTATPTVSGTSFEAESGIVTSPMTVVSDSSASGGKYVTQTTDTGSGSVKYSFKIPSTGKYKLRASVVAPDGSSNSVYYSLDGGSSQTWSFPDNLKSWTWADGPSISLSEGVHTLTVKKREKGTKLDKFQIDPVVAASTSTTSTVAVVEAESGTVSGGMHILSDDAAASNGKYVQADSSGSVTYKINVPVSGTYRIAGWIKAASGSSDSFYASMDGKSAVTWALPYPTSTWTYDADDSHTFSLSAGAHTLVLKYREKGAKIDRLTLVKQ